MLLSVSLLCCLFFLSDDLSGNENTSYSKGFINVVSELLLVYWVFKLQMLHSKSCFRRQALLERFMATITQGIVNLTGSGKLHRSWLSLLEHSALAVIAATCS